MMTSENKHRISIALFYALPILAAAGLGVMMLIEPYLCDDYGFMSMLNIHENGMEFPFDWDNSGSMFHEVLMFHAFRGSNWFAIVMNIFPKWVGDVFIAVMWYFGLILSAKLIGLRRTQWQLMSFLCLLTMIFPAFYDSVPTLAAAYGYIVGCTVVVWSLWLFKSRRPIKPIIAIATGFLLGFWQEGAAIPTLFGLAYMWLSDRKHRSVTHTALITIAGFVCWFCIVMPGSRTHGAWNYVFNQYVLLTGFPYFAFLFIYAVTASFRKMRYILYDRMLHSYVIVGAISMMLVLFNGRAARVGFTEAYISAIGIVYILRELTKGRKGVTTLTCLSIGAAIFLGAHLVCACISADITRRELKASIENWRKTDDPNDAFFTPKTNYYERPFIALLKPEVTQINLALHHYYAYKDGKRLPNDHNFAYNMIPEELRNFRKGMGEPMNVSGTIVRYANKFVYFGDSVPSNIRDRMLLLDTPWGKFQALGSVFRFTSEADGCTYFYLNIDDAMPIYRPIRGIEIVPERYTYY